jgi:hypothetical protein
MKLKKLNQLNGLNRWVGRRSPSAPVRTLIHLFTYLTFSLSVASAATITGGISDRTGTPAGTNTTVRFEAISQNPTVITNRAFYSQTVVTNCDTNGNFSVNLIVGDYLLKYGNEVRDVVRLCVPHSTNTYDFNELICPYVPVLGAYSFILKNRGTGQSNSFTQPRLFGTPYGTNLSGSSNYVWTLTNWITGEGEWRAPLSGSGSGNIVSINGDTTAAATIAVGTNSEIPRVTNNAAGTTTIVLPLAGTVRTGVLTSNDFQNIQAAQVALSNLSYVIGLNGTNYAAALNTAVTALAYVIGANATNYSQSVTGGLAALSYLIGANGTNYANAFSATLTALAYAIGANGTNYSQSVTGGLAALTYTIGANGTNYANALSATLTALAYTIGANATNYANAFFAQRRVTNYAYAASIVIDLATDVDASITNPITGNLNVLATNTVPGRSFRLWGTSDSSARTINVFCDKSIVMLSTNETANSTQVVTTASKDIILNGATRQKTAAATNLNLWAKSQP